MGTTTIFLRHNDLHISLNSMKKEELERVDKLSPYSTENEYHGWRTPLELHNGNVEVLVWWKGRLMLLRDAPQQLNKKYYDKYQGKTLPLYEWTLLKGAALNEIKELDKEFKKAIRKKGKKSNASDPTGFF